MRKLTHFCIIPLLALLSGCATAEKRQIKTAGLSLVSAMAQGYETQSSNYRTALAELVQDYDQTIDDLSEARREKRKAELKNQVFRRIRDEEKQTREKLVKEFENAVENTIKPLKDQLKSEQEAIIRGQPGSADKADGLALQLAATLAIMHKNTEELGNDIAAKFDALYDQQSAAIDAAFQKYEDATAQAYQDARKRLQIALANPSLSDQAFKDAYQSLNTFFSSPSDKDLVLEGLLGKLRNPTLVFENALEKLKTEAATRLQSELNQLTEKASSAATDLTTKINQEINDLLATN